MDCMRFLVLRCHTYLYIYTVHAPVILWGIMSAYILRPLNNGRTVMGGGGGGSRNRMVDGEWMPDSNQ